MDYAVSERDNPPLGLCLLLFVLALLLNPRPSIGINTSTATLKQHTVRHGQTLSDIAQRYGISLSNLRRWNAINSDLIIVGQKLTVWQGQIPNQYKVQSGDNLSAIAKRFGVSLEKLRSYNKLQSDLLQPGQILILRLIGPIEPPATYIVKRGNTLSKIAAAYNVSLHQIRKLNNISDDRISIGQKLILHPSHSKNEKEENEYIVRRNDTLSHIAQRFNVGLRFLQQLNNLKSDFIRPGQKLRIRSSAKDEGIHIVRHAETLSEIAARYQLELPDLKELNGIENDRILVDQKLRLRPTPNATHIVERGDALWEIARAYSMTVTHLKQLNGLTSNRIYPGQELQLSIEESDHFASYTVNNGDNLSEIARLHQMSVSQLKRINKVKGSIIYPGQTLKVKPLFAQRDWVKLAQIDWTELQKAPKGVLQIDTGNGPYFGSRPKANRQKGIKYYEGHPVSPKESYRKARNLWQRFENAVDGIGRLSNELEGWNIVLDPGHGGLDPGAVVRTTDGNGQKVFVVEDEYVYDIALRTYVMLRLHGAAATMTLLSPNHLIRQSAPPAQTFVNEKNEVYNSYELNKRNTRNQWPRGSRNGLNARVDIARKAFANTPKARCIFLSFHADIDKNSPEAPLVLYYESRDGRRRDLASRAFAQALLPAFGAGARIRGQALGVLRNNPASVKVLVELRNLAYVDHAWALRFEQLRQRDAEKVVRGVLDYAKQQRLTAGQ